MQNTDANYQFQVGDVHIVALSDGRVPATTRLLYPETPEEVWDAYRERFPEYYDGKGFWVNLGAFLVKSGSRTVLVDTGLGPHATWPTLWPDSPGALKGPAQLMNDMKTKGIAPEEIDTVFITHLHGDHVGWNLTKDADSWKPTFPKARYLVQRADWERFTHPEFLDSGRREAAERNYLPLQELGVLELLEGDQEVAAGLTAIHTAGHTPGHMSMLIASGSERALVIGDIVSSPMQVAEPDWPYAPDTNPAQALETRHRVLDLAEHGDMTVIAGHMHRPNWGRLMRWEGRRYWQAL